MNGRALNEKAIEVSPSSSRVLDRAAEILTPFPPSKNRPRPGDWTCPSCGFSNFQRRTACFRCSFPAVSAAPGGGEQMGYQPYSQYPPPMQQPMMQGPPHMGGHGGMGGHGSRGMGNNGGMVPFRAGDWKCGSDGCGYHNFAKNVSCLRCGASRAGAAVVADTSFSSQGEPSPYGMGPGSVSGTPGPGPFAQAAGAGYGGGGSGGPGGFQGQGQGQGQHFGGPPSTYALPSGLGASTGPYPPLNTHVGGHGSGPVSAGPFDNRAAEQAFNSQGAGQGQGSHSAGPQNGFYSSHGDDPFSFLSSGIGGLSMGDGGRGDKLNGGPSTRSPA
jgi:Zn-finger in Ran binding protein and others